MARVRANFTELMRPGFKKLVDRIPDIMEELRLKYLADPTAYRREKYSCKCQFDGRGLFLVSPLCFVHSDPADLDPQYRDIDPPASWINRHYGPNAMVDCFKEDIK